MGARLDDPRRLAALSRSGLLLRPLNDRLDRLVATAASVVAADAAQVNVVDDTSQHHLSRWPPVVSTEPRPVQESGCRHVVETGHTLAVPDTLADPVFCVLPWVRDGWRGYLGTPICYEGEPIGALCVLSHQPRRWFRADTLALEAVARLVTHALF